MLQESQTQPEDLEKLYIAAHTLAGTSASYGFPEFSEIAAKMAHIFHYASNAVLTPGMQGPLTEFVSDAIAVMEFDLLHISSRMKHRNLQAISLTPSNFAIRLRFRRRQPKRQPLLRLKQQALALLNSYPTTTRPHRLPSNCRRMQRSRTRFWNSSFPKRRSTSRQSRNACCHSREIRIPKSSIGYSGRCTPLKVRRLRSDCIDLRPLRIRVEDLIA